jgi:hypothetical protein
MFFLSGILRRPKTPSLVTATVPCQSMMNLPELELFGIHFDARREFMIPAGGLDGFEIAVHIERVVLGLDQRSRDVRAMIGHALQIGQQVG